MTVTPVFAVSLELGAACAAGLGGAAAAQPMPPYPPGWAAPPPPRYRRLCRRRLVPAMFGCRGIGAGTVIAYPWPVAVTMLRRNYWHHWVDGRWAVVSGGAWVWIDGHWS